jgi:hypothetical protein
MKEMQLESKEQSKDEFFENKATPEISYFFALPVSLNFFPPSLRFGTASERTRRFDHGKEFH